MILPTPRLLTLLVLAWLLFATLEVLNWLSPVVGIFFLLLTLPIVWDGLFLLRNITFHFQRSCPHIVSLGVPNKVALSLQHNQKHALSVQLFDHLPAPFLCHSFPITLSLPPQQSSEIKYSFMPQHRGNNHWSQCDLLIFSRWRLWKRQYVLKAEQYCKVYPNYAQAMQFGVLAAANRLNTMGIHASRLRGLGSEFHQLREFRVGDALNRIDWNASARTRKIISKEFQQEKQQQIIFLLDLGRHMDQHDGDNSHFEQVLNATILQTYVALKQGDSVGLMTFAGEERWLNPQNKGSTLNSILENLFDLQTTSRPADYLELASRVSRCVSKRSLIILITQLRAEDQKELQLALRMLSKRHYILLTTLRESYLDDLTRDNSALDLQRAAKIYCDERQEVKIMLQSNGAQVLDCLPQQLCPDLVNAYLNIKARQIL